MIVLVNQASMEMAQSVLVGLTSTYNICTELNTSYTQTT